MRTVLALAVSIASFACARVSTPEPNDADPPAVGASEVEGPAPDTETAAQPADEGLCAIGPVAEWSACDGQRVRLRGRESEQVMQHPVMGPDHQGYMDVEDTQLIVLTKAPFSCPEAMTAVGTLRGIDVDPDPDAQGKNSYSGWMLEDAEVTCE